MLRSDTLMLDNKLFPLYQERVTWLTFNTEHSSEQLWFDEEHCEELLVMTGTGKEPENKYIKKNNCNNNSDDRCLIYNLLTIDSSTKTFECFQVSTSGIGKLVMSSVFCADISDCESPSPTINLKSVSDTLIITRNHFRVSDFSHT